MAGVALQMNGSQYLAFAVPTVTIAEGGGMTAIETVTTSLSSAADVPSPVSRTLYVKLSGPT